jgi:hypothetical protein
VSSPSYTNVVWLLPEAVWAWAVVSNGFSDVPLLPCASLLLTYQTQPVIAIVTRPVSVPGFGPAPVLTLSLTV